MVGHTTAAVTNAISPANTGGGVSPPSSSSSSGNSIHSGTPMTHNGMTYNGAIDLFNKSIGASVGKGGNVKRPANALPDVLSGAGNAASSFISGIGINAGSIIKTGASLLPPVVAVNTVSKFLSGSWGRPQPWPQP